MSDLLQHIKKVAINDFREFFAPFVTVYRWFHREITDK